MDSADQVQRPVPHLESLRSNAPVFVQSKHLDRRIPPARLQKNAPYAIQPNRARNRASHSSRIAPWPDGTVEVSARVAKLSRPLAWPHPAGLACDRHQTGTYKDALRLTNSKQAQTVDPG